jgi:hypothetical protein
MERKVVDSIVIGIVGEYGIVRVVEHLLLNNGKVFGRKILYDVCLECGDGDIVASFEKIKDARKWAKEN